MAGVGTDSSGVPRAAGRLSWGTPKLHAGAQCPALAWCVKMVWRQRDDELGHQGVCQCPEDLVLFPSAFKVFSWGILLQAGLDAAAVAEDGPVFMWLLQARSCGDGVTRWQRITSW